MFTYWRLKGAEERTYWRLNGAGKRTNLMAKSMLMDNIGGNVSEMNQRKMLQ